jgi:PAS domain S-box-containing protein
MSLEIFILILLLSAVLSGILFVYVRLKRKSLGSPSLAWLLLSIFIWCLVSAVELQLATLNAKKILNIVMYLGIVSLPVWFLKFSLEYTQTQWKYRKFTGWYIWLVPVISITLLATNDLHRLFYSTGTLDIYSGVIYYSVTYGVWWWIHLAYSYALIVFSIFLFVKTLIGSPNNRRPTIWLIITSSFVPFAANIIYVAGFKLMDVIDITPVAFAVTGALFFWGLYSKDFFAVKPIALNTLFNSIPEGIMVLDTEKRVVDINNAALEILNLKKVFQSGMDVQDILPYKFNFNNTSAFNKVHYSKISDKFIETVHSVIKNEYGSGIGFLILIKDTTERRISEEKLRVAMDRLELASEAAGLDPWENNLKTGENIGGNKIYSDLGYTEDEIPQNIDDIFKLMHPDDSVGVKNRLKEHFEGKSKVYYSEFRIKEKKGNYQWVANFARIVEWDKNGAPLRFIGITQNINERKQVEERIRKKNEELVKANAEKDKFFSIIAHDLKGPFQGFIGLTELMSGSIGDVDENEMQEIAKSLNLTAKNLFELLENLLNWALVKRGHKRFNPQKVLLSAIVLDVEEIFKPQLKLKRITFDNTINPGITILADRESIKTILRNLVSNAVKFTPMGGNISLGSQLGDKGLITVFIKDSGIGMPESIKENLFSISKKVSRAGTDNEPSTGLGLILCKELIEKHGGDIWVESKEGDGSKFFFTIPIST